MVPCSGVPYADLEIKVSSFVENPELTNALPLNPGVGQNMAVHALPTASAWLDFGFPGTGQFLAGLFTFFTWVGGL